LSDWSYGSDAYSSEIVRSIGSSYDFDGIHSILPVSEQEFPSAQNDCAAASRWTTKFPPSECGLHVAHDRECLGKKPIPSRMC
jgi:hypothetical protein